MIVHVTIFRLELREQYKLLTMPVAISLSHETLRLDSKDKKGRGHFFLSSGCSNIIFTAERTDLVAVTSVYSLL